MKPELTPEQINALFVFVEKKGVKPYDVQVELVDHLATDIEQLWLTAPSVTFEEALQTIHAKFGRWGFDYLVQKAEQKARKQQENLFWRVFSDFFRWPKAVFTIVLAGVLWWGFQSDIFKSENRWIWFAAMAVIFLGYALFAFFRQRRIKNLPTTAVMPYWFGFLGSMPTWLNMLLGPFSERFIVHGFAIWATFLVTTGFLFTWATIAVYQRMFLESKRLYPAVFA